MLNMKMTMVFKNYISQLPLRLFTVLFIPIVTLIFLMGTVNMTYASQLIPAKPKASSYQLELDLQQAITLALAKNYGIKIAKFNPQITELRVNEQTGVFEPVIGTRFSRKTADVFDENTGFQALNGETEIDSAALFLRGTTPWGTRYKLEVKGIRNDLISNDNTIARNVIEITQPLLKGFGYTDNYTGVRLAKNNHKIANHHFSQAVMITVKTVVNAYTDLYAAQEGLKVAKQSRRLAKRLVIDNKKRVEIGNSAQSDMLRAKASYARREDQVLLAERNVQILMNRLKLLIAEQNEQFLSLMIKIKPLQPTALFQPEIMSDFQYALKQRPDYKQAKLAISSQEYIYQRDKRRNLPQVDLTLGFEQIGRSADAHFSNAFDNQIADAAYIGLEFSMPLTNRSSKARENVARISLQREEVRLQQLEQSILVEIDNAIITAKSNQQRISAADNALSLAQATLTAEEKKYKVGRSSAFFILDLQQRLTVAELTKVRVVADYYKSLVSYQFVKGNVLKFFHVSL